MAVSVHNNKQQQAKTLKKKNNMLQYNATGTGAVRRIRTPNDADVLSGRGGNVNAHTGNCTFRDLVATRKQDYNLARNKDKKAEICRQVIAQVTDAGGRFLTKEANGTFWVELDHERTIAKTSQALREGAPKIREAHRKVVAPSAAGAVNKSGRSSRVKRTRPTSDDTKEDEYVMPATAAAKRVRIEYRGKTVLPNQEMTPPLTSQEAPSMPESDDQVLMPAPSAEGNQSLPSMPVPRRFGSLYNRSNSLALFDLTLSTNPDDALQHEFVNPFADESELLGRPSKQVSSEYPSGSYYQDNAGPKVGVTRETSTSSTASDMGGLGALMRSELSSSFPSFGSMLSLHKQPLLRRASSSSSNNTAGSSSNRYAVDENYDCDTMSVGSSASVAGMPIWEWFDRECQETQ